MPLLQTIFRWPLLLVLIVAPLALLQARQAGDPQTEAIVGLLELVIDADSAAAQRCLLVLRQKVQNRELTKDQFAALKPRLETILKAALGDDEHALHVDAALLLASWQNKQALDVVEKLARGGEPAQQQSALLTLISAEDPRGLELAAEWLRDTDHRERQETVLSALGQRNETSIAEMVLDAFEKLHVELRPKAIELLTQRANWARVLLDRIDAQQIDAATLNVNQIAALQAMGDEQLQQRVEARWGVVRLERNPQREQVILQVRQMLDKEAGDPHAGWVVFRRVCGQCHNIYGEGQDVGPDLTRNGRGSLEQLLSNILDPSLVIGASYQARVVVTSDGRVLTGLLAEENDQRLVLKVQGGKTEIIPAEDVEELAVSPLSLMPEGLEQQLTHQELMDLISFLRLDKPPTDPTATLIPDVTTEAP